MSGTTRASCSRARNGIGSSILSRNAADPFFGTAGGIYNDSAGTVTVANCSSITTGNTSVDGVGADVDNRGVLYREGTSTIGILGGNPVM